MRALGALLWLAVLGFCAFNWWQIRALRSELEVQRRATVRVSERSPGLLLKMERAMQHGERARKLLEGGRQREARRELDQAMAEFSDAAKGADEATTERLHRVEETLAKFRDQTQDLIRRVKPAEKKEKGS